MKTNKLLMILLTLFFSQGLFGQLSNAGYPPKYLDMIEDGETDFSKITLNADSFFNDTLNQQDTLLNLDKMYKFYMRWYLSRKDRLDSNQSLESFYRKSPQLFDHLSGLIPPGSPSAVTVPNSLQINSGFYELGPTTRPTDADSLQPSPSGVGRVDCIEIYPKNVPPGQTTAIYIGTPGGGLWKSSDGGKNWNSLSSMYENMGVTDMLLDKDDPSILYLSSGYTFTVHDGNGYGFGLLYWDEGDQGIHKLPVDTSSSGYAEYENDKTHFRKIIQDPGSAIKTLYGITQKRVFKFTKNGTEWDVERLMVDETEQLSDILFLPGQNKLAIGGRQFLIIGSNTFSFSNETNKLSGMTIGNHFLSDGSFDDPSWIPQATQQFGFHSTATSKWTHSWINNQVGSGRLENTPNSTDLIGNQIIGKGLTVQKTFEIGKKYDLLFDYHTPINTRLRIYMIDHSQWDALKTNGLNGVDTLEIFDSNNPANYTNGKVSFEMIEHLSANLKYNFFVFQVTSNSNYNGTTPVWIDNVHILNIRKVTFDYHEIDQKLYVASILPTEIYIDKMDITDYSTEFVASKENLYGGLVHYGEVKCSKVNSGIFYFNYVIPQKWNLSSFQNLNSAAKLVTDANYMHDDTRELTVQTDGNQKDYLWAANDGGLSFTDDPGVYWKDLSGKGLGISQFYGISNNEDDQHYIQAGAQDLGLETFDKNGNWVNRNVYADIFNPASATFMGNQWEFIVNQGGSASLYTNKKYFFSQFLNYSFVPSCKIQPSATNKNTFYAGYNETVSNPNQIIGKFTLSMGPAFFSVTGVDDLNFNPNVAKNKKPKVIHASPSDENYIYVALAGATDNRTNNQRFWYTHDGGQNWFPVNHDDGDSNKNEELPSTLWFEITDITSNPTNPLDVWITSSAFNVSYTMGYHSTDGGITWSQESKGILEGAPTGLKGIPVNCIKFINSEEKLLGTDLGLFYLKGPYDALNNIWRRVDGFPTCIVSDIEINKTAKKIRIATFGRGVWEGDIPCEEKDTNPISFISGNPLVIDTDQTYNADVIILPGQVVEFKNCKIHFSGGDAPSQRADLIIKPGAKVILDSAILTSSCGGLWGGIDIVGLGPGTPQGNINSSGQGILEMKNNSVVEYAYHAVDMGHGGNLNETGGIVWAENSTFRNNYYGVIVWPYSDPGNPGNYIHRFDKCSFINNRALPDTRLPTNTHVILWGVEGIKFRGCHFENSMFNRQFAEGADRGKGIFGLNASFQVWPEVLWGQGVPCSFNGLGQRSSFKGLDYAVQWENDSFNNHVEVLYADFEDNARSIDLKYGNLDKIIGNNMVWTEQFDDKIASQFTTVTVPLTTTAIGVNIEESDGFQIENNTMTQQNVNGFEHFLVGVDINHSERSTTSSSYPDQIKNNQFIDLIDYGTYPRTPGVFTTVGQRFSGINSNLEVTCNTYQNLSLDWYLDQLVSLNSQFQNAPPSNTHTICNAGGAYPLVFDANNYLPNPAFSYYFNLGALNTCLQTDLGSSYFQTTTPPVVCISLTEQDVFCNLVGEGDPEEPNNETTRLESKEANSNQLKLIPNPTEGIIKGTYNGIISTSGTYRVLDLKGRLLFAKPLRASFRVDLSGYAKGVYIISIANNGQTETHRITLQ